MAALVHQQLVHAIKELSKEYAVSALTNPVGKDLYEYGLHCGKMQGLAMAEELITKLLTKEDRKDEKQPVRSSSPYTA